jgi:double-stranded uracil-DNA glycosylase
MGALLGFDAGIAYEQRQTYLLEARIAVWDVLQSCRRAGSLDADIDAGTLVPNDFASFFARHPKITRVYFNGAAAERVYRSQVQPALSQVRTLACARLPSTSPAHAACGYDDKLRAWRVLTGAP